jgi:hypothetical protein
LLPPLKHFATRRWVSVDEKLDSSHHHLELPTRIGAHMRIEPKSSRIHHSFCSPREQQLMNRCQLLFRQRQAVALCESIEHGHGFVHQQMTFQKQTVFEMNQSASRKSLTSQQENLSARLDGSFLIALLRDNLKQEHDIRKKKKKITHKKKALTFKMELA